MIQLLVIADDFTGAMDTGVQLAKAGIQTLVCASPDFAWPDARSPVQVLSVNTESRHIAPDKAYELVSKLTQRGLEHEVSCIYKKVDSMLRGNIAAELSAVLKSSGEAVLPFAPAYPGNGRTTVRGQLFVGGVPFSPKSADPFSPVDSPDIAQLLAPLAVHPAFAGEKLPSGIALFDAETDADLQAIAEHLSQKGCTRILAGCAGFAAMLPGLMHLQGQSASPCLPEGKILLVSGSLHPNTLNQMEALRQSSVPVQYLFEGNGTTLKDAREAFSVSDVLAVSTLLSPPQESLSEESRLAARACISAFAAELTETVSPAVLLIVGGDTLSGIMEQLRVSSVQPLCELLPGVVLGMICGRNQYIVTKSGGFGEESTLIRTIQILKTLMRKEA